MRNKRLKEIDQKLDTLLDYVVAIQTLLIRQHPMPHKTMREKTEDESNQKFLDWLSESENWAKEEAEDDHYWDPTKFPELGESDPITVSEADKHFDN